MTTVDYRKEGPLVIVMLNRPAKLNALDVPTARALCQAWLDYQNDPSARVAILTGTGRAFCAGIDVRDRQERARQGIPGTALSAHDLPDLYLQKNDLGLPGLTKPVIAAVNGLATGIGFHLAVAADLRVAVEEATFGLAEVQIGIVGSDTRIASQRLPLAIAMELALTGDFLSARRAYEVGLINRVVPKERLMDEARALAGRLLRHPPKALSYNKLTVLKGARPATDTTDIMVRLFNQELYVSADHKEALAATLEKRPGRYTGG